MRHYRGRFQELTHFFNQEMWGLPVGTVHAFPQGKHNQTFLSHFNYRGTKNDTIVWVYPLIHETISIHPSSFVPTCINLRYYISQHAEWNTIHSLFKNITVLVCIPVVASPSCQMMLLCFIMPSKNLFLSAHTTFHGGYQYNMQEAVARVSAWAIIQEVPRAKTCNRHILGHKYMWNSYVINVWLVVAKYCKWAYLIFRTVKPGVLLFPLHFSYVYALSVSIILKGCIMQWNTQMFTKCCRLLAQVTS